MWRAEAIRSQNPVHGRRGPEHHLQTNTLNKLVCSQQQNAYSDNKTIGTLFQGIAAKAEVLKGSPILSMQKALNIYIYFFKRGSYSSALLDNSPLFMGTDFVF